MQSNTMIRITGEKIVKETQTIEILPYQLYQAVIAEVELCLRPMGFDADAVYIQTDINGKTNWYSWEDTGHGSGITSLLREATEEEVRRFEKMKELRRDLYSILVGDGSV